MRRLTLHALEMAEPPRFEHPLRARHLLRSDTLVAHHADLIPDRAGRLPHRSGRHLGMHDEHTEIGGGVVVRVDRCGELALSYRAIEARRTSRSENAGRQIEQCSVVVHRGWRAPPEHDLCLRNVARHLTVATVSYTHLRAHETPEHLVCRL